MNQSQERGAFAKIIILNPWLRIPFPNRCRGAWAACGFAAVAAASGPFLYLGGKPTVRISEADAGFDRAAPPNEAFLTSRLTYPTGRFDPAWVLQAAQQDQLILSTLPAGERLLSSQLTTALELDTNAFTPLGPQPLNNTQQNFGNVSGRANVLIVDPMDSTIAYFGSDGGGVWKTANQGGTDGTAGERG